MVRLGDEKLGLKFINGFAFKSQNFNNKKSNSKDLPVLKIGNILENNIVSFQNNIQYHSSSGFKKVIVGKEDIVIALTGATVGKSGWLKEPALLNQRVLAIKAEEQKLKYLSLFLFSFEFYEYAQELAHGNAQGNLSPDEVKSYKIPLPPLNIQEEIVNEIEEVERKEEKVKGKIEKLRQKIITIISKVSSSSTKLKDITKKIGSGATPLGGEISYHKSGISLIRSQNIYDFGFVEKGLVFIDEKQTEALNNVTVEKNDILFNITGASIARCCIVEEKYLPARVNQHVSIIRTNELAIPKYVQLILVNPNYKKELLQIGEGATSRQAITKQQLEEFKIPLPSIQEQTKIVSEIQKLEKEIKSLEKSIEDCKLEKNKILERYLN